MALFAPEISIWPDRARQVTGEARVEDFEVEEGFAMIEVNPGKRAGVVVQAQAS